MEVNCPHCKFKGTYPDSAIPKAGKNLNCPTCKKPFFVEKKETKKPIKKESKNLKKIIAGVVLAGAIGFGSIFGYTTYKNNNKKQELIKQLSNYKISGIDINFNSIKLSLESNISNEDTMEEVLIDQANRFNISFKNMYKLWPNKEDYILVLKNFNEKYDCIFKSKKNEIDNKTHEILKKAKCIDSEGNEEKYGEVLSKDIFNRIQNTGKKELELFKDILSNKLIPSMVEIYQTASKRNELVSLAISNDKEIDTGTCGLWREDIREETKLFKQIVKPLDNINDSRLKICLSYLEEFLKYEEKARNETNSLCGATHYSSGYRFFNDSQDNIKAFGDRAMQNMDNLTTCLIEKAEELNKKNLE